MFCCSRIRSQSFGEPVPLDCELHSASQLTFLPLGGARWPEELRLSISLPLRRRLKFGIFLPSSRLGSDKTPARLGSGKVSPEGRPFKEQNALAYFKVFCVCFVFLNFQLS